MRRVVIVLLFAAIVTGGVWYSVTRFPRLGQQIADALAPAAQSRESTGSRAPSPRPPVAAESPPPVPPMLEIRCGGHCGTERWEVKTLSDPARDYVRLEPVDATVEELVALQPSWDFVLGSRNAPVETTVYRVQARLVAWRPEDDGDIHLILAGLRDSAATMIAEIPDPGCSGACRSGFAEQYARARQAFETWVNAPDRLEEAIVTVRGVGFFDRNHGQIGAAPNYIELHPVLAIEFRN